MRAWQHVASLRPGLPPLRGRPSSGSHKNRQHRQSPPYSRPVEQLRLLAKRMTDTKQWNRYQGMARPSGTGSCQAVSSDPCMLGCHGHARSAYGLLRHPGAPSGGRGRPPCTGLHQRLGHKHVQCRPSPLQVHQDLVWDCRQRLSSSYCLANRQTLGEAAQVCLSKSGFAVMS